MASCVPKTPFDVRRRVSFDGLDEPGRVLGYQGFRVLNFVLSHVDEHGEAPSYSMICDELNIGTKGEVSQIMHSLERRGLVSRPGCGGPIEQRRVKVANG